MSNERIEITSSEPTPERQPTPNVPHSADVPESGPAQTEETSDAVPDDKEGKDDTQGPADNAEKKSTDNKDKIKPKLSGSFDESMNNLISSLERMHDHLDELKGMAYDEIKKTEFVQNQLKKIDDIKQVVGERWDASDTKNKIDEIKNDIGAHLDEVKEKIAGSEMSGKLTEYASAAANLYEQFDKWSLAEAIAPKKEATSEAPTPARMTSPPDTPTRRNAEEQIVNATPREPAATPGLTPEPPAPQERLDDTSTPANRNR